MKVPSFKTKKARDDIFQMVDAVPTRDMYKIVMTAIDEAMDELVVLRESVTSEKKDVTRMLKRWDAAFTKFGEREAYYYQEFIDGEDRAGVDEALFEGDYSGFDFSKPPTWPDIETPWRLANDLSTIYVASGATQEQLDDLRDRFTSIMEEFWSAANLMIVEKKAVYEEQAAEEEEKEEGRVYGFLPAVAIGAVALVGLFGAAAGYSASQSGKADEYVESSPMDKHLKTAKSVGIGVAIGAMVAMLFMLRGRR